MDTAGSDPPRIFLEVDNESALPKLLQGRVSQCKALRLRAYPAPVPRRRRENFGRAAPRFRDDDDDLAPSESNISRSSAAPRAAQTVAILGRPPEGHTAEA